MSLTLFDLGLPIALSMALCIVLVPIVKKVAIRNGLVDKPSPRKKHTGAVPLVGGVVIFLATLLSALFFGEYSLVVQFYALALPLVVLGVVDDLNDVSALLRALIQVMISISMIYFTHLQIVQIGDIFGFGAVQLSGALSVIFTIICVIGVINAINMMDGCDGLAGSVLLVALLALATVAIELGDASSFFIAATLSGALVGFLLFNAHIFGIKNRVFLGDAGSMFLGFALVWLCIRLSQIEVQGALSPVAAGWLFGVPLIDVISVVVGRLRRSQSPFSPGRDHIHHLLLDNGFSSKSAVGIILAAHVLLVVFGLTLNQFPQYETIAFWSFVLLVIAHHFVTPAVISHSEKFARR